MAPKTSDKRAIYITPIALYLTTGVEDRRLTTKYNKIKSIGHLHVSNNKFLRTT